MKERPILFSGEMVRALLDGRKTQTRRALKIQPSEYCSTLEVGNYHPTVVDRHGVEQPGKEVFGAFSADGEWAIKCPYGRPGDRLWVRENWRQDGQWCLRTGCEPDDPGGRFWSGTSRILYAADRDPLPPPIDSMNVWRRRPSIHMPRRASRILLEIVSVRVERLQAMEGQTAFESDALAEGVNRIHHGGGEYYYSAFRDDPHPKNWCNPEDAFKELWESINGPGSWDANPYVWAVEFRRVEPGVRYDG